MADTSSIECAHTQAQFIGKRSHVVRCAKLSARCGFVCSVDAAICGICQAAGADRSADPHESFDFGRGLVESFLTSRLLSGDAPRYVGAIDLDAIFAKYVNFQPDPAQQRDLLIRCAARWALLAPADGGLSAAQIEERVERLARAHDLGDLSPAARVAQQAQEWLSSYGHFLEGKDTAGKVAALGECVSTGALSLEVAEKVLELLGIDLEAEV